MSQKPFIALSIFGILALSGCPTSTSPSTNSSSGTSYTLSDGSTVSLASASYSSTTSDVPAVYVSSGILTLTSPTVSKSGDTASSDSSKTGVNAAVRASSSSASVTINGGTITSTAKGGNAAFAYNGSTISLSKVTITCTGSSECRAMDATYAGTIDATDVTATTTGSNSSVVATDTGGGTITLDGGSFTASGQDSAGIYSTGTITGAGISAQSTNGEACVIEGANSITLTGGCVLSSGATNRGVLLLQSGSGDAGTKKTPVFTMTDGSLTTTQSATGASSTSAYSVVPLFEVVTDVNATITLTDVALSVASGILMEVDYNTRWSTSGATGNLVLQSDSGSYSVSGSVVADATGSATVTVGSGVAWTGAFDSANAALSGTVTIDAGGTWTLSADSYVDSLVNSGTITVGSYTLTVGGVVWSGS